VPEFPELGVPKFSEPTPLKEFWKIYNDKLRWYRTVRWLKFWLLWVAVAYIIMGAIQFYRAV
jgi:hypothetical protein